MSVLPPEVMAELQREYVAGFKDKIREVEDLYDKRDWPALRELFHKSAGSGSTYRMPEISDVALHMEYYLKGQADPDAALVHQGVDLFRKVLEGRIQDKPLSLKGNMIITKLAPYKRG